MKRIDSRDFDDESIRTEAVPTCVLCGDEGSLVYRGLVDRLYGVPGQWTFFKCPRCHFIWLNPRPVPDDLPKCYPDAYFTHNIPPEPLHFRWSGFKGTVRRLILQGWWGYHHLRPQTWWAPLLGKFAGIFPILRERASQGLGALMPPYRTGGQLLDVGCGNGRYLKLMESVGWKVAGVEIDEKAAKIAQQNYDLSVFVGDIENAPFKEESFDVITVSHVIEHIPEPISFIQKLVLLLKKGGLLIVVTPNADSLGHRLFRANWYQLNPPLHLRVYTLKSMKKLIELVGGLTLIRLRTNPRMSEQVYKRSLEIRDTEKLIKLENAPFGLSPAHRRQMSLFTWLEKLGNKFLRWGENIEVISKRE